MSAHIAASGMCTAAGLDRATSVAELSAGGAYFRETQLLDLRGEALRAAAVSVIPQGYSRTERMIALAQAALVEPLLALQLLDLRDVPVLMALPDVSTGAAWSISALEAAIVQAGAYSRSLRKPSLVTGGRASFFSVLHEGLTILHPVQMPVILLGAVDSLCDATTVWHLYQTGRLLSGEQIDGRLPGEGAAFILLVHPAVRLPATAHPAIVRACVLEQEPHPFESGEVSFGQGLTSAFTALHLLARADQVICGHSGERFFTNEFAVAYLRNAPLFPEPLSQLWPGNSLGDTGAATGALALGLAVDEARQRAQAAGRAGRVLFYASADSGQIGAGIIDVEARPRLVDWPAAHAERTLPFARLAVQQYEEQRIERHLDEIGFLIEQRRQVLRDGRQPWPSARRLEERIAARLRCVNHAAASASLYATEGLAGGDPELRRGAACCLAYIGGQPAWTLLGDVLSQAGAPEYLAGIEVGLLMRSAAGLPLTDVWQLVPASSPAVHESLMDTLSRVGGTTPLELLRYLREPVTQKATAMALARSGDYQHRSVLEQCRRAAPDDVPLALALCCLGVDDLARVRQALRWGQPIPEGMLRALALYGDERDAPLFVLLGNVPELIPEALEALGIYGLPESVPALLNHLNRCSTFASVAAAALFSIIGVRLIEKVFVPLSAEEEPAEPGPSCEEPAGELRERLSQDPQRWQDTWERSAGGFLRGQRYRRGRLLGIQEIIKQLADPLSTPAERESGELELAIKSTNGSLFDTRWLVLQQEQALTALARRLGERDLR